MNERTDPNNTQKADTAPSSSVWPAATAEESSVVCLNHASVINPVVWNFRTTDKDLLVARQWSTNLNASNDKLTADGY